MGIAIFLLPISIHGNVNTVVGHIKEFIIALLGHDMGKVAVPIVTFLILVTSLWAKKNHPDWITHDHVLSEAFLGGKIWLIIKSLSFILSVLVVFNLLPILFDGTLLKYASNIILHLIPRLLVLILVLSLTAPLLLDFGLIQFTAVFTSPIMRPLFKVPGRAAVDSLASILGSSSMAVVISAKMHESGFYNDREAATMIASFSLPGIYTTYALAALLDMNYYFSQLFFVIIITSLIIALILPRLWPLAFIPKKYVTGRERFYSSQDDPRHGHTMLEWALLRAVSKASHMNLKLYLHETISIAAPLVCCTIPLMIAVGIPLMLVAELTSIIDTLALPISTLLSYAGIEDAYAIAAATVLAFFEPYVATSYAVGLASSESRFIYLAISAVSLVNIMEVGLHVWHSKISLNFFYMLTIFIMRVTIGSFFIIPIAHYFFA